MVPMAGAVWIGPSANNLQMTPPVALVEAVEGAVVAGDQEHAPVCHRRPVDR